MVTPLLMRKPLDGARGLVVRRQVSQFLGQLGATKSNIGGFKAQQRTTRIRVMTTNCRDLVSDFEPLWIRRVQVRAVASRAALVAGEVGLNEPESREGWMVTIGRSPHPAGNPIAARGWWFYAEQIWG